MNDRDDRSNIVRQITEIEHKIKTLRIHYEQYFAGVEKRAPLRERDVLERQMRELNKRTIMQTELRYKFQNLSSTFHLYQGMWERVQREMDEGRYRRHVNKTTSIDNVSHTGTEIEKLYQDYQAVCKQSQAKLPSQGQLEVFIEQQKEKIRQKYGNVDCQFKVTNDHGKPKIKVSLKRS